MLTIDYGDTEERLYTRRPEGSLRAYWKHHRYTGRDLYVRFGKQDLTADVNFSDLISWGEALGWETIQLTTQSEFMTQFLLGVATASLSRKSIQPAFSSTIKPDSDTEGNGEDWDVGDAFKVLEQRPKSLHD